MFSDADLRSELKNRLCLRLCTNILTDCLLRSFRLEIGLRDCRRYCDGCNSVARRQSGKTNNAELVEKYCVFCRSRNFITTSLARLILLTPLHSYFFKNDFNTTLPSTTRSFMGFIYFWVPKQFLYTLLASPVCATYHAVLLLLLYRRCYTG